jgi:uncharacterized protein YoxC
MARQLVVEIVGDSSKFTKSITTAQSTAGGFFSEIKKGIGAGLGISTFNLATTAVGGLTTALTGSIDAASKLQQSTGAVESVFGSAAGKIEAFGNTAATSVGLSKNAVNEMAAVVGAQLQGMGFNADDAADKTVSLTQRAADMAATFGGTTKDAIEAVSSLLRGERDPIEKYGVSIKEADVQARLAAQGLDGLTGEARKTAEATAAMELLMEQTSNTQGQFGEESDSLAGKQQILGAKMEDISAKIGEKLLPVIEDLVNWVVDDVIPAAEDFGKKLEDLWSQIKPVVDEISANLQPVLEDVSAFIKDTVIPVVSKIAEVVFPKVKDAVVFLSKKFTESWEAIKGAVQWAVDRIESLIDGATSTIDTIRTTIEDVKDKVGDAVKGIIGFFTGIGGKISNATKGMWDGIWNAFKSVINTLIRGWNSLKFTMPEIDLGPLGKVGGFTIGTPNIPYLHQGGIVPGTPGSDVLAMLQAGERVIPRGDDSRTVTVNLNVSVTSPDGTVTDLDADKVAEMLEHSELVRALEHMAAAV